MSKVSERQEKRNNKEKRRVENIAKERKELVKVLSRVYGKNIKRISKVKILKLAYEYICENLEPDILVRLRVYIKSYVLLRCFVFVRFLKNRHPLLIRREEKMLLLSIWCLL